LVGFPVSKAITQVAKYNFTWCALLANLLIADDDEDYRKVFIEGLGLFGHTVHGVPSGKDVVPTLADHDYHVIFLDVMMRGGGAISTLHELREVNSDIPVVVITGRSDLLSSPLFREGLREASAKISKTATLNELNTLITKLL